MADQVVGTCRSCFAILAVSLFALAGAATASPRPSFVCEVNLPEDWGWELNMTVSPEDDSACSYTASFKSRSNVESAWESAHIGLCLNHKRWGKVHFFRGLRPNRDKFKIEKGGRLEGYMLGETGAQKSELSGFCKVIE